MIMSAHCGQDVNILGGLDDIQILLDDHLIKCQALRASPYMDAFAEQFKVIKVLYFRTLTY